MKAKQVQAVMETGKKEAALAAYNRCLADADNENIFVEFFEFDTAMGARYQVRMTAVDVPVWLIKPIAGAGNYLIGCADGGEDTFFKVLRK